ncbi:hypothetical protein GCM10010507_60120 [Streptomyces cinnamoneus]|uniref:Uncharacterized protein n=1 Tax=Streptomyces cinnamoneus TaxID=53446 RepID=A0A918U0U3_STRCJ|nr:hypothetical protein GCM10010507_60120 [Streptomyces cinnamoneus]
MNCLLQHVGAFAPARKAEGSPPDLTYSSTLMRCAPCGPACAAAAGTADRPAAAATDTKDTTAAVVRVILMRPPGA